MYCCRKDRTYDVGENCHGADFGEVGEESDEDCAVCVTKADISAAQLAISTPPQVMTRATQKGQKKREQSFLGVSLVQTKVWVEGLVAMHDSDEL